MFRRLISMSLAAASLVGPACADGLRDPMRPAGHAPAAPRALEVVALKLEGIIGGGERVAIINGRLVRPGESVAGVKVIEVLQQGVRIERAGKVSTLTLPKPPADGAVRVARSQETKP